MKITRMWAVVTKKGVYSCHRERDSARVVGEITVGTIRECFVLTDVPKEVRSIRGQTMDADLEHYYACNLPRPVRKPRHVTAKQLASTKASFEKTLNEAAKKAANKFKREKK